MVSTNSNRFNFFVPATFEKSVGANGVEEMKIKGICSSATEDSDGETLYPDGYDYSPLLKTGFINWNHQAFKQAGAIIGRPTTAAVINGGRDFYIEGVLYKGLDQAKDVYQLAQVLEAEDPDRKLGWSIEGQAIERDPLNPKRVLKARITGVAITHQPKNGNTLLSIVKGEYSEPYIDEDEKEKEKEEDIDKSMSTENVPAPESVEGKPKDQIEDDKILTKSEIYNTLFEKHPNLTADQYDQIYKLVNLTSEKLFNMKITDEVLEKAFNILEESALIKGGADEEKKKPSDYDKKDEIINNGEPKEDKSEDDKTKIVPTEGIPEDKKEEPKEESKEEPAAELEKDKDTVEKSFSEMILSQIGVLGEKIEKSEANSNNIWIGIGEVFDQKFGALSQILKSNLENQELIKSELVTLKGEYNALANQPLPSKSLGAPGARAVERFQKSHEEQSTGTVYSLSNPAQRKDVVDILFAKVENARANGRVDTQLEKAISDIEITKSISPDLIPRLKDMDIVLVK